NETLDYSYQKQLDLLQKVRRGVADVATSRKRLELQEAQTKIGEAFSGISDEFGDVGLAIQRAEDKTNELQARAGAMNELLETGALEDFSGTGGDDIDRQLAAMSSDNDVEMELQRMRDSLPASK
ncbi:PspA/IM30 family protein, partial [Brevibacterium paucivorans]